MMRWPRGSVLALALVGCAAEDTAGPLEFGEVCGTRGPFRVVAVGPDDDVISYSVVDGERSGLWFARLPAK